MLFISFLEGITNMLFTTGEEAIDIFNRISYWFTLSNGIDCVLVTIDNDIMVDNLIKYWKTIIVGVLVCPTIRSLYY